MKCINFFYYIYKTQNQFRKDGCDNCDDVLHLKGRSTRVLECTSPNFSGY